MESLIVAQTKVCNGDTLTYCLIPDKNTYGVEIILTENGRKSSRIRRNICRNKTIVMRFLQELCAAQVYPVHLDEILRDFNFCSLSLPCHQDKCSHEP